MGVYWLQAYSPEDVFSIWDRSYLSLTQFMEGNFLDEYPAEARSGRLAS